VRDDRRQTVDPARSGKLKWVPPQIKTGEFSHYGPADAGNTKREREHDDDGDTNMDQPLKSGRYREGEGTM
jgi:hypothetical protein